MIDETVEMEFTPRRELAGWAEMVHGGLIGTVLDEVMTWAAIVRGRQAYFAAEFSVRLRQPLPLLQPCMAHARVIASRRRILDTEARLTGPTDQLYAIATGRYLPAPPDRLAEFQHDFIWEEGRLDLRSIFEPDTPKK
jgi:acyl-coenzyme A thioesterase PaaI-like protein